MLLGPYCPIYGCGCLLLIVTLDNVKNHPIYLFLLTGLICSSLEYFGSYILEKMFNARWWDYTNYKFNLNGRICLETMLPFSILGTLVVYYLNPYLTNKINFNNGYIYYIIAGFVLDIIATYFLLRNVKENLENESLDNTEEISKKKKKTILKK